MIRLRPERRGRVWGIVLAGGEGERMRSFTSRWLGCPCPKQYCTFVGTRSMLQHTLDRVEPEYGWIEPGAVLAPGSEAEFRRVAGFFEKPNRLAAQRFHKLGWLWNTTIVAAKVTTLRRLGERFFPAMMKQFDTLRAALRSVRRRSPAEAGELAALRHAYRNIESANLSAGILERAPERSIVLPMRDVDWDDWGRPQRVVESLARIGRSPSFPPALAASEMPIEDDERRPDYVLSD